MTHASLAVRTLAGCIGLALAAATPLSAQPASVDEMQHTIESQQVQIESQQQQLDAQRELLEKLQAQVEALATSNAATASAPKPTDPSFIVKRPQDTGRPQQGPLMLDTKSGHDLESPTGSNVSPNRAAVSFEIPELKTQVGIFGFTEFQIAYDTNGLDSSEFDTFLIDVDDSDPRTTFSVNPSRFGFSSETNLGWGRINTLLTIDFNGKLDKADPRLRQAYGEFIHDELDFALLAGQAYTTGLDLKAVPETLDFAGPSGAFARRQELLRFTKLFGRKLFIGVAAENPENAIFIAADTETRLPDFYVAAEWDARTRYFDHFRAMILVRDLKAENDLGTRDSALGWAVAGSTKIMLPFLDPRDNLKLTVQYGEGYGSALKSGPFDGGIDPADGELETVPVFSAFGGIQHFWTDELRSNLSFGYVNADLPGFFAPNSLESNIYVAANLIWEPIKNLQFGFEYLYGRLENFDGNSGNANRLLWSSKFEF